MTIDELIPFTQKQVTVRLEDGRTGQGVLHLFSDGGPGEQRFSLDTSEAKQAGFYSAFMFYAREVAEIHPGR